MRRSPKTSAAALLVLEASGSDLDAPAGSQYWFARLTASTGPDPGPAVPSEATQDDASGLPVFVRFPASQLLLATLGIAAEALASVALLGGTRP